MTMKSPAFLMCTLTSVLLTCSVAYGTADLTPGTWDKVNSPTSATGSVDGIVVTASTNADAPFTDFATHSFADPTIPCGTWDAGAFFLDPDVLSLTTTNVNAGDYQQFDFNAPWSNGYFYIENFDASSAAKVTVTGGGDAELVAQSASISYTSTMPGMGILSSSNTGYNGEGDLVLKLNGPVTSIRLDYTSGEGANGVFYGFATGPAAGVIPEPTSLLVWFSLLGLVFAVNRRRS